MSNSDDVNMTENHSSVMNVQDQQSLSMQVGLDRFAMFNIFIRNALEKISSGVSEEQYRNLFGKLSAFRKSKSAPVKMHSKMKTNLMNSLMTEIETMVEEEKIKEKFNKLDKLVDECAFEEGRETWRPNGNVNSHVRSHVMAVKMKHKRALEENVRDREHATESLRQQVSMLRAEVRSLVLKLQQQQTITTNCTAVNRVDLKIEDRVKEL